MKQKREEGTFNCMSANLSKFEQQAFDQNLMKEIFEKYLWKVLRKVDTAYHTVNLSWAQQGEDLIIDFLFRNYLNVQNPGWLDIGANHASHLSNTYLFYKRGARGVNIEADPVLFSKINQKRKRDVNLNIGIGGTTKGELNFYKMSSSTLNTFSREKAEEYTKNKVFGNPTIVDIIKIQVLSVNEILEKYFDSKEDYFLSIDVEGWDFDILTSINFSRFKPPVICIEVNKLFEGKSNNHSSFMSSVGYIPYATNSINTIFVNKERFKNFMVND